MILSGRDLQWYIERGKLKIEPCAPEQFQQNGFDSILDTCRYAGDPQHRVDDDEHFSAGGFYLGATREVFSMPDDLMAFVCLRSSWARKGILIPPTIVDAGFCGNLTIEIVSHRTEPIPFGERFLHLIFARMQSPSEPYAGKYQHQRGITPSQFDLEKP